MKARAKWPLTTDHFIFGSLEMLERIFRDSHNDYPLQCAFCWRRESGKYHNSGFCDYLEPDWEKAVYDAGLIASSLPTGMVPPDVIERHAERFLLDTPPGDPQYKATLSLMTDPIQLGNHALDNGRHRVTAMFDQGASIPVPYCTAGW